VDNEICYLNLKKHVDSPRIATGIQKGLIKNDREGGTEITITPQYNQRLMFSAVKHIKERLKL